MKIVHVIPTLGLGGAERLVIQICKQLSHFKHIDWRIIYFRGKNEFIHYIDDERIVQIPIIWNKKFLHHSTSDLNDFKKYLDQFKPTVIHAHLTESFYYLSFLKINWDVKLYFHAHDNLSLLKKIELRKTELKQIIIRQTQKMRVLNFMQQRKASFICISPENHEFIQHHIKNKKINVIYLPNAIDLNEFERLKPTATDKITLISVGNLFEKKQQHLQIKLAKDLKKSGVDFQLLIVGEGPDRKKLEQLITEFELTDCVHLMGKSYCTNELLMKAQIFIHTAKEEAFGLVIVEAMAAGLPIVCFNGGGNKHLIQHGENGFIFELSQFNAFFECVKLLLKKKKLRLEIGENAKQSAAQYDIKIYVQQLVQLYTT